jgi:hypothetical protein
MTTVACPAEAACRCGKSRSPSREWKSTGSLSCAQSGLEPWLMCGWLATTTSTGRGYTARMSSGGERLIGVGGYEVRWDAVEVGRGGEVADADGEHLTWGLEVLPRQGHAASEHELEAETSGVPGLVRDGALLLLLVIEAERGRRVEWRGGGGAGQEETQRVARTARANGTIRIGTEVLLEAARRSSSEAVGPSAQWTSFFASAPGARWR